MAVRLWCIGIWVHRPSQPASRPAPHRLQGVQRTRPTNQVRPNPTTPSRPFVIRATSRTTPTPGPTVQSTAPAVSGGGFSHIILFSKRKSSLLGTISHINLSRNILYITYMLAVQLCVELVMIIYQDHPVLQALFETFLHNPTLLPGYPQSPLILLPQVPRQRTLLRLNCQILVPFCCFWVRHRQTT